jgi:methionyl-tRNA synthetase
MPRHLITSALPYVNGVKHLGNLVGSMLPADVYARFLRLYDEEEVLFICATDEHGTPAELAAAAAGLPVAEFCAQQWARQKEIGERFGLSWDYFGRSSSAQNAKLTQHMAAQLDAHGFLEEREIEQIYSVVDQRFLPDRYVVGTCPHCGYERARGDQCEVCTRLLDPVDLINPRSAVSGSTDLEVRRSKHLFLLQSKLEGRVRAWVDAQTSWPSLTRSIAYKWLDEGLEDRGITRDLSWGVPVDRPGFEHKVFYVWFDAPIEYIGATEEWADAEPGREWERWWYDTGDDLVYTQFMAKDNVPFHTVFFPATLLGTEQPWNLPDVIKSFNWLTFYGGKFSTSDGRGVFMDDALDILPPDCWRYHLLANAPESDDASFTWESLVVSVNKDLADTYGNFVNRCLSFVVKRTNGAMPSGTDVVTPGLHDLVREYSECLRRLEYRKAMSALRALWAHANAFWEHAAPWKLAGDSDELNNTMRSGVHLVRILALLSSPVLPTTSTRVLDALGEDSARARWPDELPREFSCIPDDREIRVPAPLFTKIEPEDVERWRARFGGEPV